MKNQKVLRVALKERLQFVASQAVQAQRLRPEDDRLLDLVDSIDNDLQEVIELINRLRGTCESVR